MPPKGGSQGFAVKMKYASAAACYQLTARAEDRFAYGLLRTQQQKLGRGSVC